MSEDDRAVMARLAALEAEVKADVDAERARKEAAVAKVREARAQMAAEHQREAEREARKAGGAKPAAKPAPKPEPAPRAAAKPAPKAAAKPAPKATARDEDDDDGLSSLGGALELARKANDVKQELARAPKAGEKSWIKSGVASMLLGPVGWLYAGSWRETIPASAAWLVIAAIASKIPMFLLWPVMMVALPLSGIVGAVYAVQYNRKGGRQRLFGDKDQAKQKQLQAKQKQLPANRRGK